MALCIRVWVYKPGLHLLSKQKMPQSADTTRICPECSSANDARSKNVAKRRSLRHIQQELSECNHTLQKMRDRVYEYEASLFPENQEEELPVEEQRKLSKKMEKASKVAEQLEDKIQKLEKDMRFYANTNRVAPDAIAGMARDYRRNMHAAQALSTQESTLSGADDAQRRAAAVNAKNILQRIAEM